MRFKIAFIIALMFLSGALYAQDDVIIPDFSAYQIEQTEFVPLETLDLTGYDNKVYKDLLAKSYVADPNLADKYIVIPVACGANCQTNFIANKETGKIIGDLGSTMSLTTQRDSNLIIADNYALPLNKPFYKNPLVNEVRYYVIKDDVIKPLTVISHEDYYRIQQTAEK